MGVHDERNAQAKERAQAGRWRTEARDFTDAFAGGTRRKDEPGAIACRALGLDPNRATIDDVQRAFRERAKRGHSDSGGQADMGELVAQRDAARAYVVDHYDLVPVPAVPRATSAPSPALSGPLADALRLLGPALDVRLRAALVASTPPAEPSVEHYLRLALCITEALGAMPGVLPLDAPEHRLELVERYLDETEEVLGELGTRARPATHADVARLSSGLLSTSDLCQAVTGLAVGDPLRPRLDGALRRLGAACDAFAELLEREPGPSTQGAPTASPSAPHGPGKRVPGRRGRRRSPAASPPRLPAARDGR